MLPKMGRKPNENVLVIRSHFKTDLFWVLFLREVLGH
jgi:hypothetical protein